MCSNINYLINSMKALLYAKWGKASSNITNSLPERIEAVLDIKEGKASNNLIQNSCEEVIKDVNRLISNLNANRDTQLIYCMELVKGQLMIKMNI